LSAPAIRARGLEKRFGRAVALRRIDLEIAPGTRLAVLGPNGAGKSTLLRLVAGLARPSAGSLEIAGVVAGKPAARAQIGLIAHATFLYPQLTARENLLFAGRLHGVADPGARADALLEESDLTHVAHRAAGAFSRGMAQRLAIARGLVHDPSVVLLDEPFTGLDRSAAQKLSERLAGLHTAPRTQIVVTHDLGRVAELADRALLLVAGRIARELGGEELETPALERAWAEVTEGPL